MKTSIVVKMLNGFRRACLPEDSVAEHKYIPYYYAGGERVTGIRPSGDRSWVQEPYIGTNGAMHSPRNGRVRDVRVMKPEYVTTLATIDDERDRLNLRLIELRTLERSTLAEAFDDAGVGVSVATVKRWTVQRTQRREAEKAANAASAT